VDQELTDHIRIFHQRSDSTYGAPRIFEDLLEIGVNTSKKRVARLMSQAGIRGVSRRKGIKTTRRSGVCEKAPDLVKRDFKAEIPNKLWIADITYVPTWSGFLYLAVVIDAFSRRVIGWSMASHLKTELVLDALNMALWKRRPDGVIHHSDQESQYTSYAFGQRCQKMGVRPSVGSVGDCFDNAMCESFFATLECELLDRRSFPNHKAAKLAIFEYIEGWYNPRRRHSALGYKSPINYEKLMAQMHFVENPTLSTKAG
jgi:putative transposase